MSRNDQDNTGAVSSLVMPEAWTERGACARALNPDLVPRARRGQYP